MGWFKRDRAINDSTKEFARLAGVSTMDAKRTLSDMTQVQKAGITELTVIGIATMTKVDEDPRIPLEELYGFVNDLVFNTDELTFSDGTPLREGVITTQDVISAATAAIRLYRKDYVALVQQRMKDEQAQQDGGA